MFYYCYRGRFITKFDDDVFYFGYVIIFETPDLFLQKQNHKRLFSGFTYLGLR